MRLSKTFGVTRALHEVDLTVRSHETHALVGQNGSGKSTLIKILSGYHHPDPGSSIFVGGQEWHGIASSGHDRVRFVHQDLGLILEMNAIDNVALHGGRYLSRRILGISWRKQADITRDLIGSFDVDIDVWRPVAELTPVQRVVVAIAAALQSWQDHRGVLVLDEPTAMMPNSEVRRLFTIIERLRSRGVSVLYVSHRLDEIFSIADRVTILRGGVRIDTCPVEGLNKSRLVSLMLGREWTSEQRSSRPTTTSDTVVLEVRGLKGPNLRGVDLSIKKGEIVGIAGLPGSGSGEVPYIVSGAGGPEYRGQVRSATRSQRWVNIREADISRMRGLGLVLVPADRAMEGIIGEMSVAENLSLSVLDRLRRFGKMSTSREKSLVEDWLARLGVVHSEATDLVTTLSGGNQQKVLIGRCLAGDPGLLVFSEPTAGVDIGARQKIYAFVEERAADGLAVLVHSSDLGDLEAMCTRVLVMRNGRIVEELEGAAITEYSITYAMDESSERTQ